MLCHIMYRVLLMLAILCIVGYSLRLIDSEEESSSESSTEDDADVCDCTCRCPVNDSSLTPSCPPWPTIASTPAATTLAPAPDYVAFPRAQYKFFGCENADTWNNANQTCGEDKAYLASPENVLEVYMLIGMLIFHPHPKKVCSVFIGLQAKGLDGNFWTVLDEPMPTFLKKMWEKEDLEVPDENRCLSFNKEGRIEAEYCEADHAYACKLKVN